MKNSTLLLTALIAIGVSGQLMCMEYFIIKYIPQAVAFGCWSSEGIVPATFKEEYSASGDSLKIEELQEHFESAINTNKEVKLELIDNKTTYLAHITPFEENGSKKLSVEIKPILKQ